VVEGFHKKTRCSHALKLVSKSCSSFNDFRKGCCSMPPKCPELISNCLEAVFEGPNHVCLAMRWGTHVLDAQHQLTACLVQVHAPPSPLIETALSSKPTARRSSHATHPTPARPASAHPAHPTLPPTVQALRLLHEVRSPKQADSIMLGSDDVCRLVLRVQTLDRLLQANLFI
jgi:hypothetical protein